MKTFVRDDPIHLIVCVVHSRIKLDRGLPGWSVCEGEVIVITIKYIISKLYYIKKISPSNLRKLLSSKKKPLDKNKIHNC